MQFSLPAQPVAVDRLVDGHDDVGHRDGLGAAAERVAAAGAARALDELVPAQLAEQLFQVRQGDLLALRDGSEGDRTIAGAEGQIDHCRDSKSAFGGQTHGVLSWGVWGCRLRSASGRR
jgi:hypothetical protein